MVSSGKDGVTAAFSLLKGQNSITIKQSDKNNKIPPGRQRPCKYIEWTVPTT